MNAEHSKKGEERFTFCCKNCTAVFQWKTFPPKYSILGRIWDWTTRRPKPVMVEATTTATPYRGLQLVQRKQG
jgi:hypothetical protein